MPILSEKMYRYLMPEEIEKFLDSILEKIRRTQPQQEECCSMKFEELYGILPETHAVRHGRGTPEAKIRNSIEKWNLSEVLTLKNPWDDMNVTLWKLNGRYYCMKLKLFQKGWEVSTEPSVNLSEAEEIFPIVSRRLQLLASAFGNTPLRQLGVRQYIHEVMMPLKHQPKADFYLEFFLTLCNLELAEEELGNQDLFLKRAKLHCREIISRRSQYGVEPEVSKMAETAAVRGIGPLLNELFIPMNRIWGFLANRKVLKNLSVLTPGKFCFCEYYDSRGNIELGEIFPVPERENSSFKVHQNRDCYTQVFPDYQTALMFRNIALALLRSSNTRR